MKVGYTVTQLAGRAFAQAQASLHLLFYTFAGLALGLSAHARESPVTVPFKMVGNTMFVDAKINGQAGLFLFDTGASDLVLNSAYFIGSSKKSELVGLYGDVLDAQHLISPTLEFGGSSFPADLALVLDLEVLEKAKKLPIAGIIGYSVLKDYELQIDFESQLIMLFSLKKMGRQSPSGPFVSANAFDFKMSGHIPYLEIKMGNQLVRMGIDSGSERNLLQPEMLDLERFEPTGHLLLVGLTPLGKRQEKGMVNGCMLGDLELEKVEVILTDLRPVSGDLPVELHGILGIQFLKNYKVAINFQLRKIYLWQPKEGAPKCQLAVCEM